MIVEVAKHLWVGNSRFAEETPVKVRGILNVAFDLQPPSKWWPDVEYAQVGLVDGPGNEVGDYAAALMCLRALVRRHGIVVVYDHDGSRALMVAMMHLNLKAGHVRPDVSGWSHWATWLEREVTVAQFAKGKKLPKVHEAHVKAFDAMSWGVLAVL